MPKSMRFLWLPGIVLLIGAGGGGGVGGGVGCGGTDTEEEADDDAADDAADDADDVTEEGVGTVIVQGATGSGLGAGSLSLPKRQEENRADIAELDSFHIRMYRVSLAPEEDPQEAEANGSWQDISDETDDTTDCVASMDFVTYNINNFTDIGSGAITMAQSTVPAATYNSLRLTLCDHMLWAASGDEVTDTCGTTEAVMDVLGYFTEEEENGTDGVATVQTFYFSTTGTADDDMGLGEIDDPFLFETALTVAEGETRTVTAILDNGVTGSGMFVQSFGGGGCDVGPPTMQMAIE